MDLKGVAHMKKGNARVTWTQIVHAVLLYNRARIIGYYLIAPEYTLTTCIRGTSDRILLRDKGVLTNSLHYWGIR